MTALPGVKYVITYEDEGRQYSLNDEYSFISQDQDLREILGLILSREIEEGRAERQYEDAEELNFDHD